MIIHRDLHRTVQYKRKGGGRGAVQEDENRNLFFPDLYHIFMSANQILNDVNCTSVLKKILGELVQVKRSHPETYEAILNLLSDLRDVDLDESGVQASFKSDRQNIVVESLDHMLLTENAGLSSENRANDNLSATGQVNTPNLNAATFLPANEIHAETPRQHSPEIERIPQQPSPPIPEQHPPQSEQRLIDNESNSADTTTMTHSPVDKLLKTILAWNSDDIHILSKEYQMLMNILKNMTDQIQSQGRDEIVKLFYELEILDSAEKWISSLKAVRYLQFLSAAKRLMSENSISRVSDLSKDLVDSGRLKATECKKFKSRITKCEKIFKVVSEIGSGILLIKGLQWSLVYKLNDTDLNEFIDAIRILPIADSLRSVQENSNLGGISWRKCFCTMLSDFCLEITLGTMNETGNVNETNGRFSVM